MRQTCLNLIHEFARKDKRIFYIGSDPAFGTLKKFQEELPEQFFLEGINEQNIMGMAAGMALEGKIPYVNTIATFCTRRCFEQIVLDVGLHAANVRIIGNGGGLVYSTLGPTHQATDDIGILRTIPGMTIIAPADANEMRRLMPLTIDYQGPIYIRVAKGYDDPIVTPDVPFEIGKAIPIKEGNKVLLITTGITLKIALEISKKMDDIAILHVPTLKPIDTKTILRYISKVPKAVTIEEHSIIGGLGSTIAEIIAESGYNIKLKRVGIPDVFVDDYGTQDDLLKKCGITIENVIHHITS